MRNMSSCRLCCCIFHGSRVSIMSCIGHIVVRLNLWFFRYGRNVLRSFGLTSWICHTFIWTRKWAICFFIQFYRFLDWNKLWRTILTLSHYLRWSSCLKFTLWSQLSLMNILSRWCIRLWDEMVIRMLWRTKMNICSDWMWLFSLLYSLMKVRFSLM